MQGLDKMTLGSWRYYDHEVVRGLENYFAGRGEEPGRWVGAGAEAAGLSNQVEPEGLGLLFDEGRHPLTGEALGKAFEHSAGRTTITGYSLSFSPPKSISLLWALGDEAVNAEVRAAHDEAVGAAMEFLEEHAAFTRSGKGGTFQADTAGLVAAAFVHRSSRAGDPQLHTHVLVANKVRRIDGKWLSLDGRELYACQKPSGMLYNAVLRAELTRRLGAAFTPVNDKGQAEVAGVPEALVARFSQRRRQVLAQGAERIAAAEAALGRGLTDAERAEAYQRAALDRRPAKAPVAESDVELRARWEAEACSAGHPSASWLDATLGRVPLALGLAGNLSKAQLDEVVAALTDRHSTFGRAEVAKALAPLIPAGVGDAKAARAWLEQATRAVFGHRDVVSLSCPLFAEVPQSLRRADGMPSAERHGERRWTTRLTLAREALVLGVADDGRRAGLGVVAAASLRTAVADAGLSDDQAAAVAQLCRAGAQVACMVGPAGAGKTRALRAAAVAWTASGHRVHGAAVSAMAAGVLEAESGIASDTLVGFLRAVGREELVLDPNDVVVVDEAGMVATAEFASLVGTVADAGAKVVFVGDDRQLSPVGAGGLFRLLVDQMGAARLGEVRRFTQFWERSASLRLRAGDASVLELYQSHGRIVGGTRTDMVEVAFDVWRRSRADGYFVAVLAPDHVGVDALALRARAHRVATGEVEAAGVTAGNQIVGVGDEVVTCRNDRRLRTDKGTWVRNGQRWVVTARHPDSSLTVSSLDGAGDTVLPRGYVGDHVRLAYALTVHKAQGLTVDRSILLADRRLSAELAYVGLTRGRHENIACVVVEDDARRRGLSTGPAEILGAALARSGTEPTATQVVRDQLDRSEDLGELYPLLEQARAAVAALAGPDRTDEIRRLQSQVRSRPMIENRLRSFSDRLGELEQELVDIAARRDELAPVLRAADERFRWRRPRREAVDAARAESDKLGHRRLEVVESRNQMSERVARLGQDLAAADYAAKRLPALEAEQADREQWLRSHPPEVVWVKELRRRIDARTRELGLGALHDPPEHLVRLLGPPGTSLSRDEWAGAAGRIEAYRKRWRLKPNELSRPPSRNSAQTKHWREVDLLLPELQHRQTRRVSREIDHGLTM